MEKDKIVILGGLGYLGTALCQLYSGLTWCNQIVVVDNRFVAQRVKDLTAKGFIFRQGDLMDEAFMADVLKEAQLVYHLAGITDVAYTKTEANDELDARIKKTGTEGTRIVLKHMDTFSKLIFPSTHVVFEGSDVFLPDITEEHPPSPVLAYASSKAQSEQDIQSADTDYVILRLGSVYGYGGDATRIGIMPNLFSKMAAMGQPIKLFGGGTQWKSLVGLQDVVRCMKFVAESDSISRELFHLTNEQITVRGVAELCKSIKPGLELISTDDEVPNPGYTLSNEKLLNTGFTFRQTLQASVSDMISAWSTCPTRPEWEYIVPGVDPYCDERGQIVNYKLPEPINLIGLITSKAGSMRANHYHPIQEQKCLLLSGKYVSVTSDVPLNPFGKKELRLIRPGDIAVIKPNISHTMVFLQDSVFLNLVNGEREHANYGVTHTIPYPLVDEELKNDIIENYKWFCRVCRHDDLWPFLSLGESPLANNLKSSASDRDAMYPLQLNYCPVCHNVQLSYVVPPGKMFDTYLYASSTAASFRAHFEQAARAYVKEFGLNNQSLVVDIGSNDGVFLRPLQELGVRAIGVEPAENIARMANEQGLRTLHGYFNSELVAEIVRNHGRADLVTASNVFAHADDIQGITTNVFALLKEGGTFIIEVQYLLDTLKDGTFDNIYHEHVNYWSLTSLRKFFKSLRLDLYKFEHIDTHGGSIRCYIRKSTEGATAPMTKTDLQCLAEGDAGLRTFETYRAFAKQIATMKENFLLNLYSLTENFREDIRVAAYGAPAKATTALNYLGMNSECIAYAIEDNPLKHGLFIPGVNIPIVSGDYARKHRPDIVIVLAWNFFDEIVQNNKDLVDAGTRFYNIVDLYKAPEGHEDTPNG